MEIIGELINTSRKLISEAVKKKDGQYIRYIAKLQQESGATYIDVNCGTFMQAEVEIMKWLVDNVLKGCSLPLCIDSPNPLALDAGLGKSQNGRPMINSITGEDERWSAVLPLIKKYNSKIIALCIDNTGMPKTQEDRLRIAEYLVSRLTDEGIDIHDIYIDPLIKPISAGQKHGVEVLDAIEEIMAKYPGIHTVCGLTNISYSLPARKLLNRTFMIQTMARGMDSYILDPTDNEMRASLMASQTLMGQDRFSRKFIKGFRDGIYK
ncbi:5-methyltetrahydrofolate--homocysteine methyltransferase [Clostridiaceae bacterium BL-3]|nr:5-methyltetrahydrofolate--homocysteine methyltransferase [Clostridiaceae bacterium BL-3]